MTRYRSTTRSSIPTSQRTARYRPAMDTRAIAVIALVIAIVVLLIIVL
jgi:hypothetical protein